MVSEDLRQEATGLQSLIGVISGALIVGTVPLTLPKLALRIEFEIAESFQATPLLTVVAPSLAVIIRHSEPFITRSDLRNVFAVIWSPVVLTELGRYTINFGLTERLREVGSFTLTQAQISVQQGGRP